MKKKTGSVITVKAQFIGYHKWDGAPAEVSFLQNYHRHVFYVTLCLAVGHDDREKEFFMVQRQLKDVMVEEGYDNEAVLGLESCEMIATNIGNRFYDMDVEWVKVSEDNENSTVVFYKEENEVIW